MAVESPITPERERELLSCGESPRLRTCSDDDDARLLDHLVRVLCSSRLGRRTRDDHKLARLGSGGKRSWLLSCPHLRGFVLKLASLLGIILVAQQSSRNPHIVYSYPPSPQAVPRTSKPIYPSARRAAARSVYIPSPTSSSSSSSSDSSDEETDDADADAVHKRLSTEQYLGFSDGILAELLSPNRELCDQPFELVVDHLAFVGHPVWLGLGDEEPARREADVAEDDGVEVERGRSRRRKAERGGGPLGGGAVEDREKTVAPPLISRTSSEPPNLSRASSGSPASPIKLVRSPSSSSSLIPWSSLASSQQSHTSIHGASRLISFNLLCVIDTPPDSHLSSHLEGFYKDVVVPVTANIKALERKGKWLGKEAAKLRRARENYVEKGLTPEQYLDSLPQLSPLAAALSQLYTSLKASLLASITLGSLPVQVLLRGEVPIETDHSPTRDDSYLPVPADVEDEGDRARSAGAALLGEEREPAPRGRPSPLFSRMRRRPPVRFEPWETLLPLEDPEELKRDVEVGTLLWRFLDICSPTLTFAEYETLLDIEVGSAALREVVEHLVYWRKARVVDVVSLKGVYAPSPYLPLSSLPSLSVQFHSALPTLPPLPVLLSQIPPNDAFSSIIPSPAYRASYLSALIWLLQHSLIEKQRTYLRIVISDDIKRGVSMLWGSSHSRTDSVGTGSGDEGLRRKGSRTDLDDVAEMVIVGSALSNSPPVSRSAQSARMRKRNTGMSESWGHKSRLSAYTFSSGSERPEPEESERGTSVVLEPGRPTAAESKWLGEICRDKDQAVVERFERMIRMLNGAHHLDEIRHRTSLTRKEVRVVRAAFDEHLITFTHP